MRDVLGPDSILGYCTNVHAGADYSQMLANLQHHALAVKQKVSPDRPMGVGLWLAQPAAEELLEQNRVGEFKDWLDENGLLAFTFNGFPYGDFHQHVVKHKVYEPDWKQESRLEYTQTLATILSQLLPADDSEASISTLPLGWPSMFCSSPEDWHDAASTAGRRLLHLVRFLAELESKTGRLIHVDIEPEPGCCIDTAPGLVQFFEHFLFHHGEDERVRRYLRVCHDICHTAVMFEDQVETLKLYRGAGIAVGKVQISSAVRVRFDQLSDADQTAAVQQLQGLAEDRYLHQTVEQADAEVGQGRFFEDLPQALAAYESTPPTSQWRIHFHVPVYLERFGLLESTRDHVQQLLTEVGRYSDVRHFEVETYAWTVLSRSLQCADLAEGIAREMLWVLDFASEGKAASESGP